MNLEFDPITHTYRINSQIVPGVTSVTGCLPKPWAMAWVAKETCKYIEDNLDGRERDFKTVLLEAKGAYKRKADTAASKGTSAHDFFEKWVKGRIENVPIDLDFPTDPEVRNSVDLFLRWETACKPEWLQSEVIVGSELFMYGGKFDAVANINGVRTLIDFKTSTGIYPEQYIQLAGYQCAAISMGMDMLAQRMILWTPKKGSKFEARIVPTSYEDDRECFLAALSIYKWLNYKVPKVAKGEAAA